MGLAVLLLSSIGLQVVNPQIMRRFVDAATSGEALSVLIMAALSFMVLVIVQQVLNVGATYLGENVAWTATNALRAELAQHCLRLDMGFHNNTSPGELIERIDGDVSEMATFFSQLVIRVIGNVLLLAGILVALFLEDWRVGTAFAIFAALALVILYRVRDIAVTARKAQRAAEADLFGFIEERLAGTEDIRSCGAVEFCIRGLYKRQAEILKHFRSGSRRELVVHFSGGMLMMLAHALAFVAGFYLFRGGLITIGTAYVILYYVNILGRPIHELTQHTESLQMIGACTQRLSDLRAIDNVVRDGPGAEISTGPLELAFQDVSFAYVQDEPVLHDLSFRVRPRPGAGPAGPHRQRQDHHRPAALPPL